MNTLRTSMKAHQRKKVGKESFQVSGVMAQKKYAKKLKREFEERVKDLELEEEINNMFKRDMGKEKPSQITEKQVVEMISDFEVSDR